MKLATQMATRLSPDRMQRYSIILVLILIVLVFGSLSDVFLTGTNIRNILLQASATAIAAVGVTFVLLTGEIDISVGSLMSLSMTTAWIVAVSSSAVPGGQAPVGLWVYPIGLLTGLLLGLLNGFLIYLLGINSFVATLATMFVYRGAAWKMVGSSDKAFAESAVMTLGRGEFLGIGLPVYAICLVALAAFILLKLTPLGRFFFAVGGSRRSAVETGIPVDLVRILAFGLCGLCTALAGLITIGRVGTLQAGLGTGFEFTVIAAAVLGGTSLLGGRGTIFGSIVGAIILVVLDNGLNMINASVYIYDFIKGVILILALIVDLIVVRSIVKRRRGISNVAGR